MHFDFVWQHYVVLANEVFFLRSASFQALLSTKPTVLALALSILVSNRNELPILKRVKNIAAHQLPNFLFA